MRSLLRFCHTLALAVWVGGGAIYTFVLTPAIFGRYPRDLAGDVVGTLMPHYFATLLAATVLAAVFWIALWRSWPPLVRALSLALVLAALGGQAYVRWRLYPEILEVKSRVTSFESDPDSAERRRFRSLHGESMLLNVVAIAEGVALLALAQARRKEPPAI